MTNHVPEATKPASGDYAWLGAEAGSVADLMYMLNTAGIHPEGVPDPGLQVL